MGNIIIKSPQEAEEGSDPGKRMELSKAALEAARKGLVYSYEICTVQMKK